MSATESKNMPDFCRRRYPFHYTTALNVLMGMGVDVNCVDILAVGEYENYRGEIQQQVPSAGTPLKEDTRIVLKVGYPSAVDYMPYQVFYGLHGITSRSPEWEDKARTLMAPFDASVIRYDAIARNQVLKFSFELVDLEYLLRYLKLLDFGLWQDSQDVGEALLWVSLLPTFHFWAGNPDFVVKVLHRLFGYDFRILEGIESEYCVPDSIRTRLGSRSAGLGQEFVLGRSFKECDSSYELQIRGVIADEVVDLLPGKPKRRKLEWVLSICMPNSLDCTITVKVDSKGLVVGKKEKKRFLGYSTFI